MTNTGATLHLTYGTMAAGKSTLALQLVWQLRETGSPAALWTFGDRSGDGMVTSRLGISAPAQAVDGDGLLDDAVEGLLIARIGVLVVDEAQFASPEQVDVLASLVDDHGITVHCFALATDFRGELFPGTARLFALADVIDELPLATYCWCGARGRCNARVVDGRMVSHGEQVVVGDTVDGDDGVRYQVLCRRHFLSSQLESDEPHPF